MSIILSYAIYFFFLFHYDNGIGYLMTTVLKRDCPVL